MEAQIVEFRPLSLVGMSQVVTAGSSKIATLWGRLMGRMHEIPGLLRNGLSFGISSGMQPDGTFTYTAALEVGSAAASTDLPPGMVKLAYPAATYAVFPCTMAALLDVYSAMLRQWLPSSRYVMAGDYAFELYGPDFDDGPDAPLKLFLPIARE